MAGCSNCDADIAAGARFCSACGTAVPNASTPSATSTLWPEGEKRHLTLMFCDLVGSTAIGQRLDAEEYSDLIEAYVNQAAGAIEAHGGYVSQVQGDGIVAYFGFPAAHDNDPERAVRAGLAIHESLRRLNDDVGEAPVVFQARVGIHSGPVVVNEVGRARRELLALGDTSNTAARVESITPPGRVGISDATRKLIGDTFAIASLGEHQVKGIIEPLIVYAIDGLAAVGGGDAVPSRATSPFVGRDNDHRVLGAALSSASAGMGATIVISGEPGIGKSRLAFATASSARSLGFRTVSVKCSAYGGAEAFDPIVDLVMSTLSAPIGSDPSVMARHVEDRLSEMGADLERTVAYLLALARLPPSPRFPMPVLGTELQRDRTTRAVVSMVQQVAKEAPSLVLIEDMHWIDPSSLSVLVELAAACESMALLLMLTTRPTFEWPRSDRIVRVERLDADSSREIVRGITRDIPLPMEVEDQIVARADGVPLFLEELTAAVIGSGDPDSIPETLHDSLTARLDQLGAARAFAQIGALIGRSFDRELLAAVAKVSADELDAGLSRLVDSGILLTDDSTKYTFKHALIQDAAAGSLVRRTRRRLHSDIVDSMLTSFADVVEAAPARLARHCTEAGRVLEAIGHHRRAAALATARFANVEACEHLGAALGHFESLDDADRTVALEIALRAEYGGPLGSCHGQLADPVEENYRRLEQLEIEAIDIVDRLGALLALTVRYLQVAQMESLVDAGGRLMAVADELGMPLFTGVGHLMCGVGGSSVLAPVETIAHLEAVEVVAAAGHLPPPTSNYEPDLRVLAAATNSLMKSVVGDVTGARERLAFALSTAGADPAHPASSGTALTLASNVHLEFDEPELCVETSVRAIELARRHGFIHYEAMNLVQHGWATTRLGGDGSDDIRLGLKLLTTSTMSSFTHQLRVAGTEAILRDDLVEARAFIDQAWARAEALHERGFRPILGRLLALIDIAEGRPERAVPLLADAFSDGFSTGLYLSALNAAVTLRELCERDDATVDSTTITTIDADGMVRQALGRFVGGQDVPVVILANRLLAGEAH